ncbi:hypothetical protein DPMN_001582 [Dreissena polymorpha]|uniref:Uncharacterized protein n=1 Tax=Dreissena polymorpha TaxID=45954 RepID=A0A9D4MLM3_DREPO|nr:hypothetical protein DPMN_001582 [Dreissena polymorpha]
MLYKIVNDLVDIPANHNLIQAPSSPKDHKKKYHLPTTSTSYYKIHSSHVLYPFGTTSL